MMKQFYNQTRLLHPDHIDQEDNQTIFELEIFKVIKFKIHLGEENS